jgi:hypothetical protein
MKVPNMTAMAMIQGLTCGTADAGSADGVGVSVTGIQPRQRDDARGASIVERLLL